MSQARAPRSIQHEYQHHVEREVEAYKESVSRAHLLGIADQAQSALAGELQLGMRDVLLAAEVDRIIAKRLKLPSFATWRRLRLKNSNEPKRPEYWGLRADTPLAYAISQASLTATVVVSGARVEGSALYLAANGCQVTAVEPERDVVDRVLIAAEEAGLKSRVRGVLTDLSHWSPDGPVAAVIFTPAAFSGLSALERNRVISALQKATTDGGVHLVETLVAGMDAISEEELAASYAGWDISFVQEPGAAKTFMARKHIM